MDFLDQTTTSKHVFLLGNIFPARRNTDPKTFPLGATFCLQNITYFLGAKHPSKNSLFREGKYTSFQGWNSERTKELLLFEPQIEVFSPDEKTTKNWWCFGGKEVMFFENVLLLKMAGKAVRVIPCSEEPQKYGRKVRHVCTWCFGTENPLAPAVWGSKSSLQGREERKKQWRYTYMG